MNIQQIIDANDYKQVFRAFKSGQYHAELNKVLLTKSILVQYYYIKTLKEVSIKTDFSIYTDFARTIAPNKTIFHNILTMYEDGTEDCLKYCHPVEEGLPPLQKSYDIALEVFKD